MSDLTFSVPFTLSGAPATGLTLAEIDLYLSSQNKVTGAQAIIWNGTQNPTSEVANGMGKYIRILSGADLNTFNYFVRAEYTGTPANVDDLLTEGEVGEDHIGVWELLTSVLTTAGSIGKLIVDNLNATISSRSSHSAADIWAVATRVLTAGTNIVLAKGTGVTGFNDLSTTQVNAEVDTALTDYDGPTHAELVSEINSVQADVAALNDISSAEVNSEVDTALADVRLDELLAADSDIDGAAPPTVGSVFHELLTKTPGSFTYDQTTDSQEAIRDRGDAAWGGGSAPTVVEIRQEMDNNSTKLAAIVTDTSELQTDWVDGGRLDTILDDRASQASLNTLDDYVDTEVAAILAALTNGTFGLAALEELIDELESRLTALRAANLDNLDALVSSRATPAQVATALTTYDGPTHAELISEINSVQADITALNDISPAEVNAEVDMALADYDSPTHAELVSEVNSVQSDIAALNDISPAQVNSEVDQALADINLDHLVGTATAIPAVPSGTYLDQLMDDGTQVYDRTTHSLQAIADNTGGEATLSSATLLAIAKAVLKKGIASMENDGDFEVASIGEMILGHFESSIIEVNPTTGSWVIRKVGGTTFNTRPVTLDATALPVKGVT